MDNKKLAELLFPHVNKTPEDYEAMYPPRELPEGARVTRLGPSPTGFIHLGNLFGAITDERMAHQSGGVFYLRIEDTDEKRKVEGAVDVVIDTLRYFGVEFDEGAMKVGEKGDYGPYYQRQRADIYHCFAKKLVEEGKAYPCFCTEEELSAMREKQEAEKANFGYYGKWATHRHWDLPQIEEELKKGTPYVLRFRAPEPEGKYFKIKDAIRGELSMPVNDMDFVLLKSDGIPTYHFAHVVDDHLMRTTHVVRGEEWLATLPFHVALFGAMGWKAPVYCHTAQLMKIDNGVKRKLSKRKDPELSLDYYKSEGYLPGAVWEYLMTVLNSNFEEWRMQNPTAPIDDFKFSPAKMGVSGSLFDLDKLNDVSKNYLATLDAETVYSYITEWAKECDAEYYELLTRDPAFSLGMISIGRGDPKPRKDISHWKQSKEFYSFFFDELFRREDEFPENVSPEDRAEILRRYAEGYDHSDNQSQWFGKIRAIAEDMGYAPQPKLYKKNPEAYKGHVGDVSGVIRVAITGRQNSPDIWAVQQVLGEERSLNRIKNAL
ncbi:MAG: glutamate--tRNA ligase [Oscillospiraceae bacterium]|nr:glutamate--tRNA ligase [Oscillospiraceae bacterium]